MSKVQDSRISILDGFRAIAIISVLLYHYFYRWNDSIYPYFGGDYFHYGFKGVSFFFMISGFVICYSLQGTSNFITFWKKRFIRLFPSMLIASLITFVFLMLFDYSKIFADSTHFRNLLTSITFLPPNLFDFIFATKNHFSYLNYSYWSLWPEIQFYLLASTIYFVDKLNFKRNFIIICFALLLIYNLFLFFGNVENKYFIKITNLFNLLKHLCFFLSGALFYMLYKEKKNRKHIVFLILAFVIINFKLILIDLVTSIMMYVLFFCFIYFPDFLRFLENKAFVKIGVSSYFLYLIHEYIGVVLIKNNVSLFYPASFIAPVLVMIFIIILSIAYTQKIELKLGKYFNELLLKKKNA